MNRIMKLEQRYMTMTEMALKAIRRAILTGQLRPNSHLVPAKLAEVLDLSQEAIRDAIRQLAGTGLVKTITNKGSFIGPPPDLEELKEIYQLRLAVEPILATRALENIGDEESGRLKEINRQMEEVFKLRNVLDYFLLNREFHLTLYRASGWKTLCRVIEQLLDRILIFQSMLPDVPGDYNLFNSHHLKIIKAIKNNDLKIVREHTLENLNSGLDNIFFKMEKSNKSEA